MNDLNAALKRVDYVLLVTLQPIKRNLFATPQFKAMQSHARFEPWPWPLAVEEDLIAALRDGEIAGAALDVSARSLYQKILFGTLPISSSRRTCPETFMVI